MSFFFFHIGPYSIPVSALSRITRLEHKLVACTRKFIHCTSDYRAHSVSSHVRVQRSRARDSLSMIQSNAKVDGNKKPRTVISIVGPNEFQYDTACPNNHLSRANRYIRAGIWKARAAGASSARETRDVECPASMQSSFRVKFVSACARARVFSLKSILFYLRVFVAM